MRKTWKAMGGSGVSPRQLEDFKVEAVGFTKEIVRFAVFQDQLSQGVFEGDFPETHTADEDLVRLVFQKPDCLRSEATWFERGPDKSMCIEEVAHELRSSSSVMLKSRISKEALLPRTPRRRRWEAVLPRGYGPMIATFSRFRP